MKIQGALILAILPLAAGCAWSAPPQAKSGLLPPMQVRPKLASKALARLQLMPQGHWALVQASPKTGELPKLTQGQLISVTPHEQDEQRASSALIFAVQLERDWGAILQRIDHQALPALISTLDVEVKPIEPSKLGEFRGVTLCTGQGVSACAKALPAFSRHDLYAIDESGQLKAYAKPLDGPQAPFARDGMLWIDAKETAQYVPIRTDKAPQRWIAVAQPGPQLTPGRAHIVMEPSCGSPPKQDALTRWSEALARTNSPPHSLAQTEQDAYEQGAEVLISCGRGRTRLRAPSLWRPRLRTFGGEELGPLLAGADEIELDGSQLKAHTQLVAALGQATLGDWSMADALMERWLLTQYEGDSRADSALGVLAQVMAVVRPEAALVSSWFSSRKAWRRSSDIAFLVTQVAVMAGLGQQREQIEAESKLGEVIGREPRSQWRPWLAWRALERELGQESFAMTSQPQRLREGFSADPKVSELWMDAVYLELARHGHLPKELRAAVSEALTKRGLAPLWQAINTRAPLPCPTNDCSPDNYGNRIAKPSDALIEALLARTKQPYQPGFAQLGASDDVRLRAASLIFSQSPEQAELYELAKLMGRSFGDDKDGLCRQRPELATLASKSYGAPDQPMQRRISAMLIEHLDALCEQGILEASSTIAAKDGGMMLELIEGYLERAAPSSWHLDLLERGAQLATTQRAGRQCARWGLALVLVKLRRGDPQRAQQLLVETSNCIPPGKEADALSEEAQVLGAFIQYERTGRMSLGGVTPKLKARLERAQPKRDDAQVCPGLVDRRPDLKAAVSPWLWAISGRFTEQADLKAPPSQDLALWTSAQVIAQGQAQLQEGGRQLAEGDMVRSAQTLVQARDSFARAGYEVGARKVHAILEGLYEAQRVEDEPTRYMAPSLPWLKERIGAGQLALLHAELLQKPQLSPQEQRVALATTLLFEDKPGDLKRYADASTYKSLCEL